ncbi:MAG: hypothetical protein KF882_09845 [Bacteroidia bacterium]|nr:hypothetical protein [Bacteroidia bacterium]
MENKRMGDKNTDVSRVGFISNLTTFIRLVQKKFTISFQECHVWDVV